MGLYSKIITANLRKLVLKIYWELFSFSVIKCLGVKGLNRDVTSLYEVTNIVINVTKDSTCSTLAMYTQHGMCIR